MPRTEEALDAILRSLLARNGTSLEARLPGQGPGSTLPPLPEWATTAVHSVKVSLHGAKPPVWRRLEVPSDLPLSVMHEALQTAFGWFDCHQHLFETGCGEFGDPAQDLWSQRADESTVALAQVAPLAKDRLGYVYDFGDDWRHDIVVEAVRPAAPGVRYPRCTAARGIAPEEDSGGIKAFNSVVGVVSAATSPAELTRQLTGLAGVVVPAS